MDFLHDYETCNTLLGNVFKSFLSSYFVIASSFFLSIPLCFLRVENIFAKNTFNVSDTSRGMAFRGKRIFIACFSASIDFTISSNFDGNKHIYRIRFSHKTTFQVTRIKVILMFWSIVIFSLNDKHLFYMELIKFIFTIYYLIFV